MNRTENQTENQTNSRTDKPAEEKVNVRHTITAEETFTLAKDVFDLRCFIKNVYANRAVIARRLNILTLSVSAVFTALYAAYVLFTALTQKLRVEATVVLYVFLVVYVALLAVLLIVGFCSNRAKAKNVIGVKRALAVFKILVRLASIAISVVAIVFSNFGSETAGGVAVKIVIIALSIIMLIIQIIPLLFGGFGKMARWLLSPVRIKYRFSAVVLEWYELAVSGNAKGAVKKVSSRYFDDIGALIDNYLIPALGKRYINSIKPSSLLNLVDKAEESDKPVLEGVLKNVFAYAAECGYVTFDPCKDLKFEGSVEEEEKPQRRSFKSRILNVGTKIGKSVLNKYIQDSIGDEDKK